MTQAFDAATAACRIVLEIHHRRTAEDFARSALRAALPAEPPAELIEALEDAVRESMSIDIHERVQAPVAYFAIRAAILGEDA